MTKVKICGITNYEDAKLAVSYGADYLGFNFAKSPRRVNEAVLKPFIYKIPDTVQKVGLFVNEKIHVIKKLYTDLKLDYVQLHGDEDSEYVKKLELPIIKVFRIRNQETIIMMEKYIQSQKNPDFPIIIDAYHKEKYGGTGRKIDIQLVKKAIVLYDKIMLAGGLNDENISSILKEINLFAVDVSSGLEQSPGKKDPEKLKKFMRTVKSYNSKTE